MHNMHICANMSPRCAAVYVTVLLLAFSGCGGSGEVAEDVREESYAEVKVMVEDFANLYAENKERAKEEFPGLVETLDGYAENPIGDQGATMQALYDNASKLESNFDDASAVEQLVEQADKLPGDAAAFRQQLEEDRD